MQVKMMNNPKIDAIYGTDEMYGAKLLELPFSLERFSLLLILPSERNKLKNVEENIYELGLSDLLLSKD